MEIRSPGVIQVETEFGDLHFHGRDTGRPILLMISGAFATSDFLDQLQDRFPHLDVLRAHLPGNHCPAVAKLSVGGFAEAYSAALSQRFAGRDVVAFGFSVGGLVALGLRLATLRGIFAIEPILLTDEAWPLVFLREQAPSDASTFLWNVFGVGPQAFERRDYRSLLTGLTAPTRVLLGEPPPPPGEARDSTPGLVGPLSRAALRAHPGIEVIELPGVGHHIAKEAQREMLDALQGMLSRIVGPEAAAIRLPDGSVRPAPSLTR